MTNFCITTSARSGHDLGFKIIVVTDAMDGPMIQELVPWLQPLPDEWCGKGRVMGFLPFCGEGRACTFTAWFCSIISRSRRGDVLKLSRNKNCERRSFIL